METAVRTGCWMPARSPDVIAKAMRKEMEQEGQGFSRLLLGDDSTVWIYRGEQWVAFKILPEYDSFTDEGLGRALASPAMEEFSKSPNPLPRNCPSCGKDRWVTQLA